ncbi:methyl-CpG-binding domain protein 3 [Episyrphus balteatus]|uniref:methyl-CpG-binding domain protein 3 n=1 Tax=Episyrphus balteatus TaxID=286459 RepID=UPI0024858815|nr:methyl-CpG-binding domain protein 3 [Episyrphus balteatus]XP_055849517.1 methyl-CpG-binding domain protein 3 [Episyrphus balteatus]
MNPNITIERKRIECNSLPKGWQREEVLRKSGISAGKVDVYYYSPSGKKFDSKPQLARQLGDTIDISAFDFQSGKTIQSLPPPSISLHRCSSSSSSSLKRKYKSQFGSGVPQPPSAIPSPTIPPPSSTGGGGFVGSPSSSFSHSISATSSGSSSLPPSTLRQHLEFSRAFRTDVSLVPPIRQTASIFKQPVTVVRNHENGKVKHDLKNGNQEKPKQLFWEKRLEGLRACNITGEEFDNIELPRGIRSVGPNVDEQTVLQSVATALHVHNQPVTGQTSSKTELTKNSGAFLNPDQPLMQSIVISEDDIRRQEDRVSVARRKLQEALKI